MTVDLDRLQQRLDDATDTPWVWDEARVPTLSGRAGDPAVYPYDVEVLEASHSGGCGCRSACDLELDISEADRTLIAEAISVLPALIAELRRRRAADSMPAAVAEVLDRWSTGPALAQLVVAELRAAAVAATLDAATR